MALSADRNDPISIHPSRRTFPVAAGVKLFGGALIVVDQDGFARPARDDVATDTAVGWPKRGVDNTGGAAGAKSVEVRFGIMRLRNDALEPVTKKQVQKAVYIVDDDTVSASSKGEARSVAGVLYDVVQDYGVQWVEVLVGPQHPF